MWWVVFTNGHFRAVKSGGPPPHVFSGPFKSQQSANATIPGAPTGPPSHQKPVGLKSGPTAGATPAISATALVGDFEKYKGTPYVTGGGNPHLGWDCSGAINWVLGHDFNMRLPGAVKPGFSGNTHGPVVVNYVPWKGAVT